MTTHTTKTYCTHPRSSQTNTRYGNISFKIINKLNSAAKMTSANCVLILNVLVKDKNVKKLLPTIHITILNDIR